MSAVIVLSPEQLDTLVRRAVREELHNAGPETLTTAEAAALFKVKPETICEWIKQGLPTAGKAGRQHRIRRADLEQWARRPRGEQETAVDIEALAGKLARRSSRE